MGAHHGGRAPPFENPVCAPYRDYRVMQARSQDFVQEGASLGNPLAKTKNSSDLAHYFLGPGQFIFYFFYYKTLFFCSGGALPTCPPLATFLGLCLLGWVILSFLQFIFVLAPWVFFGVRH